MKRLYFLVVIAIVGIGMYQIWKGGLKTSVDSPNAELSFANVIGSVCEEQLEKLPDIHVEKFDGTPKQVDFSTLPEAKTFKTMIVNAVSSGSNFAGHYSLATWGCGTDCLGYAVIDNKTGTIITYRPVNESYLLGGYGIDKNILVLEPVYAGQEREFYQIKEGQNGDDRLELICSEKATKDRYDETD